MVNGGGFWTDNCRFLNASLLLYFSRRRAPTLTIDRLGLEVAFGFVACHPGIAIRSRERLLAGTILLLMIFSKDEQDDLTAQQKRMLAAQIRALRGTGKGWE